MKSKTIDSSRSLLCVYYNMRPSINSSIAASASLLLLGLGLDLGLGCLPLGLDLDVLLHELFVLGVRSLLSVRLEVLSRSP